MATRIRLELEGEGAVRDEIRLVGDRAREAKPVLRIIQQLMLEGVREQFESHGTRGGFPWLPDTEETVSRKEAEGLGDELMVKSGETRESLFGGAGAIKRLSKSSTSVGTRVFQARFAGHRRELLKLTTRDADVWAEKMVKWLLEGEV